jgi:hypothetical protein
VTGRRTALWGAVAVAAAAGLAGCALFGDAYPDRSCKRDSDCFRAQGEVCDETSSTCIVAVFDAAVPVPDAAALPDSSADAAVAVDAAPDAAAADAGPDAAGVAP